MNQTRYRHLISQFINRSGENLLGVLTVGSIARKSYDKLSDYDFILIWKSKKNLYWPEGACRLEQSKCGIRNVTYKYLNGHMWSQIEKHSYSIAIINYDPGNIIPNLIKNKCIWESKEKTNIFCEALFKLSYIVNITNNYKECWNEREELQMALKRGQSIFASHLVLEFVHSLMEMALVADNIFIPSHKVCFSEWIKDFSPLGYEVYKSTIINNEIISKPDVNKISKIFKPLVIKIIQKFEVNNKLPKNIMKYRNSVIRKN